MQWVQVCEADLESGQKRIVEVEGREIVVARVGDDFLAIRGLCPHQGAPLGEGRLSGTMIVSPVGEFCWGRTNEILRCPWHGYEFDMRTGQSLHDPQKTRVKSYPTQVVDGFVELEISG
jgi:nitrite reductase (NADH) small subunit